MKPYIVVLRFPLAVLVVLIHAYNSVWVSVDWGTWECVPFFFSRVLPSFAVPLFFSISGYLFFIGGRRLDMETFMGKLRRRVFTLLIPYLTWNLLAFLLYALQDWAAGHPLRYPFSLDLFWGCRLLGGVSINWLGFPIGATTACVQEPLWFVRDLMVVVLFAPVIYLVLRRGGGKWMLLLLAAVYYARLWPNWGGISFQAVWYFSLGAYWGILNLDPLRSTSLLLRPSCVCAMVSAALLLCVRTDTLMIFVAQQVYILSAIIVCIHWAQKASRRFMPSGELAASCFFLYAAHTMVLLPLTTIAVHNFAMAGGMAYTGLYLLCALSAVVLCLVTFSMIHRFFPRVSAPLTGVWDNR